MAKARRHDSSKHASFEKKRRYGCTLVAIAKNEGRYIAEWIAYHLSVGIDRICVYVNDSSDSTAPLVGKLSRYYPVRLVVWPSADRKSPQLEAYNDALTRFADTNWMGFWDIDEFIVPFGYKDVPDFLTRVPEGTSAIGVNTRSFGSSGVTDPEYHSVLHTFRHCARPEHHANRHIKTLVRPKAVRRMRIHHAVTRLGQSLTAVSNRWSWLYPARRLKRSITACKSTITKSKPESNMRPAGEKETPTSTPRIHLTSDE